jgi:hypothetical protein
VRPERVERRAWVARLVARTALAPGRLLPAARPLALALALASDREPARDLALALGMPERLALGAA